MKNKYIDLIDQTFDFPQEEFQVIDGNLSYHDIPLMDVIEQYGTPLKFTYLPKIGEQIKKARTWFKVAMAKVDYKADYHYCYCTKSSHFAHVLEEVLKHNVHLETSSAFDINIVMQMYEAGLIDKEKQIICNGFKTKAYLDNIAMLINEGFENCIPIFDNYAEVQLLENRVKKQCNVGIRIATEEEPKFEFYTSRLGIGYKDIVNYYKSKLKDHPKFKLKMLHFFINTGINDNAYYWNELNKCLGVYKQLKDICDDLDSLNIGGGFPIKNSLAFEYDYEYIIEMIVEQIKTDCDNAGIPEPHLYTEFGSFTVGESGGLLYTILNQKKQNDRERWNMINSSFMTTLPDSWALSKKFVMLPINRWEESYERVLLGGLTCDSDDYYNSEQHTNAIFLPKYDDEAPLHIGFFNTGAYQDTVGGYGGIQHCLIPAPKYIIIDKTPDGDYTTKLFAKEQSYKSMLKILGY